MRNTLSIINNQYRLIHYKSLVNNFYFYERYRLGIINNILEITKQSNTITYCIHVINRRL